MDDVVSAKSEVVHDWNKCAYSLQPDHGIITIIKPKTLSANIHWSTSGIVIKFLYSINITKQVVIRRKCMKWFGLKLNYIVVHTSINLCFILFYFTRGASICWMSARDCSLSLSIWIPTVFFNESANDFAHQRGVWKNPVNLVSSRKWFSYSTWIWQSFTWLQSTARHQR